MVFSLKIQSNKFYRLNWFNAYWNNVYRSKWNDWDSWICADVVPLSKPDAWHYPDTVNKSRWMQISLTQWFLGKIAEGNCGCGGPFGVIPSH